MLCAPVESLCLVNFKNFTSYDSDLCGHLSFVQLIDEKLSVLAGLKVANAAGPSWLNESHIGRNARNGLLAFLFDFSSFTLSCALWSSINLDAVTLHLLGLDVLANIALELT